VKLLHSTVKILHSGVMQVVGGNL